MTRTSEAYRPAGLLPTPAEAAKAQAYVYEALDMLADPASDLHAAFYGPQGVTDGSLIDVRHPFAGSTVMLANETNHMVWVGGQLHNVGTFKRLGALFAAIVAKQHDPSIKRFVTASAGNHALGVAAAAASMGARADIYCREDISPAKRNKLERIFNARILADYTALEDAMEAAADDAERTGDAFIHPFDQLPVIAGQATIGKRLARQFEARYRAGAMDRDTESEIDAGVGGGGLLAGVALGIAWAQDRGVVDGHITVAGAQMERCNGLDRALSAMALGKPVEALFAERELDTSCDGTAVRLPGRTPLSVVAYSGLVKGVSRVSKAEVGAAMQSLARVLHHRIEPAGALGWAGAFNNALQQRDSGGPKKVYVPLVTGMNVSPELYQEYTKTDDNRYKTGLASLAPLQQGEWIPAEPTASRRPLWVASGAKAFC